VSDTPRTEAELEFGHTLPYKSNVVPADFARELERELNEAKKSPWKPLSEMPSSLKDGRCILFRWKSIPTWADSIYWNSAAGGWASSGPATFGSDSDYASLNAEYMEIPK
jgi:hypothetical protein